MPSASKLDKLIPKEVLEEKLLIIFIKAHPAFAAIARAGTELSSGADLINIVGGPIYGDGSVFWTTSVPTIRRFSQKIIGAER